MHSLMSKKDHESLFTKCIEKKRRRFAASFLLLNLFLFWCSAASQSREETNYSPELLLFYVLTGFRLDPTRNFRAHSEYYKFETIGPLAQFKTFEQNITTTDWPITRL